MQSRGFFAIALLLIFISLTAGFTHNNNEMATTLNNTRLFLEEQEIVRLKLFCAGKAIEDFIYDEINSSSVNLKSSSLLKKNLIVKLENVISTIEEIEDIDIFIGKQKQKLTLKDLNNLVHIKIDYQGDKTVINTILSDTKNNEQLIIHGYSNDLDFFINFPKNYTITNEVEE